MTTDEIRTALASTRALLLARRELGGGWRGRLSDSPLATAVAVSALAVVDRERHAAAIRRGVDWLASVQHDDGGWGDALTDPANLSATVLAWAACGFAPDHGIAAATRSEEWLVRHADGVAPEGIVQAVLARYGQDRTFSAPILTLLAVAGKLGSAPGCWEVVPQLPFELAALPRWTFRLARLEVVSYALPALIAVGLVRHRALPACCSGRRMIRNLLSSRMLRKVSALQPASGGFLEATPLTGFVALSVAAAGHPGHPVVVRAVDFLLAQQRPGGGWPVDADLAQWCTTLAVKALAGEGGDAGLAEDAACEVRKMLLRNQLNETHPYTGAAPGGWAWTDRPGGVPDVDDTAGALLALRRLSSEGGKANALAGIRWLLEVQNADGGWPTFCRGWGRLPFDRSCADLSAHALRALHAWRGDMSPGMRRCVERAVVRATAYLRNSQRSDGAWLPLWFGNPWAPGQANPVYGTAQVLVALQETGLAPDMRQRGAAWLRTAQAADGGWGGVPDIAPSVEETALAVYALAGEGDADAVRRGLAWLRLATDGFSRFPAAPIGLYFASLWYDEELYPLIFTVAVLGRVAATAGLPGM